MPLPFSLEWTTVHATLCPTCLEVLTNENVMFCEDTAFCPLCVLPVMQRPRDDCLRILGEAIAPQHWACFRGLYFFAPSRRPKLPVQLVRTGGPDDWLLDPDADLSPRVEAMIHGRNAPTPVDDNPVPGGSPI